MKWGLLKNLLKRLVQFKALVIEEGIKVLLTKKQAEFENLKNQTYSLLNSLQKEKRSERF